MEPHKKRVLLFFSLKPNQTSCLQKHGGPRKHCRTGPNQSSRFSNGRRSSELAERFRLGSKLQERTEWPQKQVVVPWEFRMKITFPRKASSFDTPIRAVLKATQRETAFCLFRRGQFHNPPPFLFSARTKGRPFASNSLANPKVVGCPSGMLRMRPRATATQLAAPLAHRGWETGKQKNKYGGETTRAFCA